MLARLAGVLAICGAVLAARPSGAAEPAEARPQKTTAASPGHSDEDYASHIEALRKRLPNDEFQIVIEKPFVVIGDEPIETVRRRSTDTIRWAVSHLKREYFSRDPDHIIDIWLFRDKGSYEKHVAALWGAKPTTPYGYYSPQNRALIMNISTGGGTLVHEIVHPFMRANFSACPDWLNEGMGSLYEQCGEAQGRIHGYTNWRLEGLQRAIRGGPIPTFADLTGTKEGAFYRDDPGTNYAQARYLCYYLQQRGLLHKFFHDFRKAHQDDPTGYDTLKSVLGRDDMEAFQTEWQAWVLKLRFPDK